MKEIWKDIAGFEGRYQVSNLGRVKSLSRLNPQGTRNSKTPKPEHIYTPIPDRNGYAHLVIGDGIKNHNIFIHRLVAQAFIPNPDNLPLVNHKDENPFNNCVDNLEWCTHKYNSNYGTAKYRWAEKNRKSIKCIETGKVYPSAKHIEEEFGYKRCLIRECCRHNIYDEDKKYTSYKLHWIYTDE